MCVLLEYIVIYKDKETIWHVNGELKLQAQSILIQYAQQQVLYLACPFEDTRRTSPSLIYFCPGGNDDFGRTSPKSRSQTSKPSPNSNKTQSENLLLCQEPSEHVSS